jgi:hypothetical protein
MKHDFGNRIEIWGNRKKGSEMNLDRKGERGR